MSGVPRNDPYPCGSGKKYKRCCGLGKQQGSSPTPTSPDTISARLPRGLPGIMNYLTVVPIFANPSDARNIGGPNGLPGNYEVIFTLARPGFALESEGNFAFVGDLLPGDSHLAIARPASSLPEHSDVVELRLGSVTEDGTFQFQGFPNKKGFLSALKTTLAANGVQDARIKATRAIGSALSNISIQLDMPLSIYKTEIVELRTGNRSTSLVNPHTELPLQIVPVTTMPQEFRIYASFYREALNSNTPSFQYLCFFKVIEGLRARRERLVVEATTSGQSVSRKAAETIPVTAADQREWLNRLFNARQDWSDMNLIEIFLPEVMGKKINRIIDDHLRPLRNRIAHGALDDGEPVVTADESMDVFEVYRWLPITKCILRRMFKNDFPSEFLTHIQE